MRFPSKEIVEWVRSQYPVGTRVELTRMDDVQAPPIGTKGTVTGVDDTASILVSWDNGSHLNVVYGEDRCEKISETLYDFLKMHPAAVIHIMSPDGYVDLNEDRIKQLLDGKAVKAHPGDSECYVDTTAGELLSQVICSHSLHEKKYFFLTDYPQKEARK